ncbi:MAG: hypothetical protein AABW63_04115 [Nanoarchaeota archaeon]
MFPILTLIAWASVIFTLVSLVIILPLTKRFSGKLKNTIVFLSVVLILLFIRGTARVVSSSKIIPFFTANLETINIFMNFMITLFVLIAILNLNKAVKIIDKQRK